MSVLGEKDNRMGKQRNNSSGTRKYTLLYIIAALTVVTHLCGCDNRRVYSHYEHLDLNGWERNDTAFFGFRCHESGTYSLDMGFRTNHEFPYKSLSMVVEHIIFPSHSTGHSTIRCSFYEISGGVHNLYRDIVRQIVDGDGSEVVGTYGIGPCAGFVAITVSAIS